MQDIQAIKRPTKRAQRNLHNLVNNTQSLVGDESDWIREGPDLAALYRGPEYSWLNTCFEDIMSRISKRATLVSTELAHKIQLPKIYALASSFRFTYNIEVISFWHCNSFYSAERNSVSEVATRISNSHLKIDLTSWSGSCLQLLPQSYCWSLWLFSSSFSQLREQIFTAKVTTKLWQFSYLLWYSPRLFPYSLKLGVKRCLQWLLHTVLYLLYS